MKGGGREGGKGGGEGGREEREGREGGRERRWVGGYKGYAHKLCVH